MSLTSNNPNIKEVLTGSFNRKFYKKFLRKHLSSNGKDLLNYFYQVFGKKAVVNYILINIPGYTAYSYNELWLLDVLLDDDTYYPIYIEDIHTGSYHNLEHNFTNEKKQLMDINELINNISPLKTRRYISNLVFEINNKIV